MKIGIYVARRFESCTIPKCASTDVYCTDCTAKRKQAYR